MSTPTRPSCAAPTCTHPGILRCSGCNNTVYCSRACQTHKPDCPGCKSTKCMIIRATSSDPSASAAPLDNNAAFLEPYDLRSYGDEAAEMRELREAFGWRGAVSDVGKFYDHAGSDNWWVFTRYPWEIETHAKSISNFRYYFVYAEHGSYLASAGRAYNEVASLITYKPIWGDVAVVRSGPIEGIYGNDYPKKFSRTALEKTIAFYKTNSRKDVFIQREKSRFTRRHGLEHLQGLEGDPRGVPYFMTTSTGVPGSHMEPF